MATGIAYAITSYLCQVACFSPSGLVLASMCGCAEHFVAATISPFLYLKEPQNLSLHISETPNNSWAQLLMPLERSYLHYKLKKEQWE